SIADARENQRLMMNKYGSFLIPFVILSALLISGLLFYSNVMNRRNEIGILKAMGKGKSYIILMRLMKALFLGLAGTVAGFFAGSLIAEIFGERIFQFTAAAIRPLWNIFGYSLIIFPLLWMLSSWIPALAATRVDAAKILSGE
ncbi:MAG: FtsX-like permease family protein, partial [Prolixibacteraceae bacterium]|nr:FtsX-like permease family protein [Prolixibacteraceae bacterium]